MIFSFLSSAGLVWFVVCFFFFPSLLSIYALLIETICNLTHRNSER